MSDIQHPVYVGDAAIVWYERPCAAGAEEGTCEDAARQLQVDPKSEWTRANAGRFGWVCTAHHNVMTRKYDPQLSAAYDAQLRAEGRAFWDSYGEESGEVPRARHADLERDSLNRDA